MKIVLTELIRDFGFCDIKSFLTSLFVPRYSLLFISFSTPSIIGESFFGMSNYTLLLLIILIKIELITGIWAAKVKKETIVSKKLQRFILKIMIYFFFIMMFHQLSNDTTDFTQSLYEYMHSFTIMYFVFVHLKSIGENYDNITNKKSEFLILIQKMNQKFFNIRPSKKKKVDDCDKK